MRNTNLEDHLNLAIYKPINNHTINYMHENLNFTDSNTYKITINITKCIFKPKPVNHLSFFLKRRTPLLQNLEPKPVQHLARHYPLAPQ